LGLFGSNTMSFLGGVAEGASKEIARQQSSIDALIKDASQVIMADRLATRKRRQTRMSDLSDKYNVLKNKGLGDKAIKVVLEQDLYDDVLKIAKKPTMTPTKLNSFITVTGGTDVNMNKSSLLDYLVRDIVDTDLSGMKFTGGGVDTLAALGLRKPMGETIQTKVDLVTPKKTIEIDDNLSKITGSLSTRGQRALDTRTKMSSAAFYRSAASVLADQAGIKLDFKYNASTGGFDIETDIEKGAKTNEILQKASELTKEYDKIVYQDFSMDDTVAYDYLLFPKGKSIFTNTKTETKDKTSDSNVVKDLSSKPKQEIKKNKDEVKVPTLIQSIKNELEKGSTKYPPDLKNKYISSLTLQIMGTIDPTTKKNFDFNTARAMAQQEVRNLIKESGLQ
tara:strand:- start:476 stop:1654 length:1179 start_codon:yes stop_codon:yes gene_type:complete